VIQVKIDAIALALAFWLLPLTKAGEPSLVVNSAGKYKASQYRELGLSYQQQGRYPEAIAAMNKSVELDPGNIIGRVNLGWAQHLVGQEDAAAKSLLQALYHQPFSIPALNALGIVYLVSGKLASAVAVHTWAATLKPDDEIAYYNLSLAFHRLQMYDSAIKTASRAAALEPHNPHPLVALAIAHWDKGDRTFASKAYRKALNLDSRYSDRDFLAYLKKAGFSSDQIRTTERILWSLKRLK
jgi:Flp pilus assembly protein TadD